MARLRTHNSRRRLQALSPLNRRIHFETTRDGPLYRRLIRDMEPISPRLAAYVRQGYRAGLPAKFMADDLERIAARAEATT